MGCILARERFMRRLYLQSCAWPLGTQTRFLSPRKCCRKRTLAMLRPPGLRSFGFRDIPKVVCPSLGSALYSMRTQLSRGPRCWRNCFLFGWLLSVTLPLVQVIRGKDAHDSSSSQIRELLGCVKQLTSRYYIAETPSYIPIMVT